MKVSIVGGGGRVGSTAAYALQLGGMVQEIALVDVNQDLARGEALDLMHGMALSSCQRIYAGGYEAVTGSDVVIITAGLRRKPDESRLDLVNRNVRLFDQIMKEIMTQKLAENAILLIVANPVDILTMRAIELSGMPAERVIGLGTLLDTTRFRSFLGDFFGVSPRYVNALLLGEHGDTMVPVWSTATVNGVPLEDMPGYTKESVLNVYAETRKSGAEVIKLKGGAGYAVGLAIRELVEAIALDKKAVIPVSSLQTGVYGVKRVCYSIPCIVGRNGIEKQIEMTLSADEKAALMNSAKVLREMLDTISQQAA